MTKETKRYIIRHCERNWFRAKQAKSLTMVSATPWHPGVPWRVQTEHCIICYRC